MNKLNVVWLSLVFSSAACGPSWNGKVSGYSLDVRESLFVNLTDAKGTSYGGLVVLSDQPYTCPTLVAAKAPANTSLAVFAFRRQADGTLLSPDVGDYVVATGATAAAAASVGSFLRTDANGTPVIPKAARVTSSGLLQVTALSLDRGTASGSFEGKFGPQNDAVSVAFQAGPCSVDSTALAAGFVGAEMDLRPPGGPSTGPRAQSASCARMVLCYTETHGPDASLAPYQPNGTCWSGTQSTADACTAACGSALTSLRQQAGAAAACFE